MGGFPRGVSRPTTQGRPRGGTAPVCALQWYSIYVGSTVVHHLCVQYSGAAPVCAVQWCSTCVYSTVVQHLGVQYSGTAPVCAVQR